MRKVARKTDVGTTDLEVDGMKVPRRVWGSDRAGEGGSQGTGMSGEGRGARAQGQSGDVNMSRSECLGLAIETVTLHVLSGVKNCG